MAGLGVGRFRSGDRGARCDGASASCCRCGQCGCACCACCACCPAREVNWAVTASPSSQGPANKPRLAVRHPGMQTLPCRPCKKKRYTSAGHMCRLRRQSNCNNSSCSCHSAPAQLRTLLACPSRMAGPPLQAQRQKLQPHAAAAARRQLLETGPAATVWQATLVCRSGHLAYGARQSIRQSRTMSLGTLGTAACASPALQLLKQEEFTESKALEHQAGPAGWLSNRSGCPSVNDPHLHSHDVSGRRRAASLLHQRCLHAALLEHTLPGVLK